MFYDYAGILMPLLLHMVLSELIVILTRGRMDTAASTTLVACVVIPLAGWMYRRDMKRTQDAANCSTPGDASGTEGCKNREKGIPGGRIQKKNKKRYIARSEKKDWKILCCCGALCFLGGGVLNVLWSGILRWIRIETYFSNQTQERLLASQFLLQVIGLGVLVPIAEELIFRGLIYRRMQRLMPVRAAVLLSALLFALYHGNVIQMIFAFPMAIVLAVIYERGKLFAFPVLFHMGANLTAVFLNFF